MKFRTWKLMPQSQIKNILSNRWIFKIKRKQNRFIDKYKAHLVVSGCEQRQGTDYQDIFAFVIKYETIQAFLAAFKKKCTYKWTS